MDEAKKKEIFGLRLKFEAMRTAILSYINEGVQDGDSRMVQARHKQRMIAEELTRLDPDVQGIAFEREGDLHRVQQGMARKFGIAKPKPQEQIDAEEGQPAAQVIRLKNLHFKSEAGEIMAIDAPPNLIVGLESLRMEGKASSILNRTLSVLEGSIGVDYVIDKDPESEIVFYVPITGGKDGD